MNNPTSTIEKGNASNKLLLPVLLGISMAVSCAGVLALHYMPLALAIGAGVPIVLTGLYWLLKSPYRCMYALIISLPLEAAAVLEVGFTLRIAYLLAALCALCTWSIYRIKRVPESRSLRPLAVFALISTISLIQIVLFPPPPIHGILSSLETRASGMRYFVQLFMLLLHVLLFLNVLVLFRERAQVRTAVKIYVVVAVIIAIYTLYQPVAVNFNLPLQAITNSINTNGIGYGGVPYASTDVAAVRPRATFQEPGNLGQYLLTALAILLLYNPFTSRKAKLFHYLSISILTWGIIVTIARGTYISLALIVLYLLLSRLRRESIKSIGVMLCSILLFAVIIFPVLGTRKTEDVSFTLMLLGRFSMADDSSRERVQALPALISVWSKHPVLGVGLGAYGSWGSAEMGLGTILSACGVWWSVLVETGILGLIAYIWFIAAVLLPLHYGVMRCRDPELRRIGAGLMVSVVGALVQYLFFADRMSTAVWFLLGLCAAMTVLIKSHFRAALVAQIDANEVRN